jgi:hypothetical protein
MPEFAAAVAITKQVVMRAESTSGTDPMAGTYLAADIIEADAASIRETNDPNEIRNLITKGNLGNAPALKGPRVTRIDFRMPIRGLVGFAEYDDTPEQVPSADRPLRGCRLGRTFTNPGVANSSVLYKPTSAGETFTIYVPVLITGSTAQIRKYTGCQGNVRSMGVAGEGAFHEFSFIGSFLEEVDGTFVAGTLVNTPEFPTVVDADFQIGSTNYAPRIKTFTFDAGQRIARLPSINAATGVSGFKVVDRNPRLVIDPEIDTEANSGWFAAFRDGVPLKDCTWKVGKDGAAGHANRLQFQFASDGTTANLQVVDYQREERDDVVCARITLTPLIAAGNDDWGYLYN